MHIKPDLQVLLLDTATASIKDILVFDSPFIKYTVRLCHLRDAITTLAQLMRLR